MIYMNPSSNDHCESSPQRNHYPQVVAHSTYFLNVGHKCVYLYTIHNIVLDALKF